VPPMTSPEAVEAYRMLVAAADDAILIADWESAHFIDVNEMALELLGYSREELLTMSGRQLDATPPEDYEKINDELKASGHNHALTRVRRKDGSVFEAELWTRRYQVGERDCHVVVLRPRGDAGSALLRGTRMRLFESEAINRNLVRFTDDAVFVCELATGAVVQANRAMCELFGYAEKELVALTHAALHPPDEALAIAPLLATLRADGAVVMPNVAMRRRDGRVFRAHLRMNVFEAASQLLVVGVVRDVTAQLERERKLRETTVRLVTSEAVYRGVVSCTDDAIFILDYESGLVVEANPAACDLFGYQGGEWNALTGAALHPPGSDETLRQIREELDGTEGSRQRAVPMRRKDGSHFPADLHQNVFEASGRKLVVAIVRDMTARVLEEEKLKQTQVKLLQAQKLAAAGEVAAGVAHEINNPAGFVSLNLDSMAKEIDRVAALIDALGERARDDESLAQLLSLVDVGELRAMLADNREGMDRIRSVARDLLVFSRVDRGEVADVDLNAVVRSTVNLLGNELRHRARLTLDLGVLPVIAAERSKLAQVVTNLLMNAAQAIVEGDAESNEIRVVTRADGGPNGGWVSLAVADTGVGLSDEVKARMFEPFFTTKPREQGTGLGLSLCAEIIKSHRGELTAEDVPGRGARLVVCLPVDTGLIKKDVSLLPPSVALRGRRILVIDDDGGMVRAYRRLLTEHDALIVSSGIAGLAAIDDDPRFDLILCDLMMPDMDGPQVYEAIAARAPELLRKLVFCTGGAFTPRAREFLARVALPVLDKPLDLRKLEVLLARHADATSASSAGDPDAV
jgi:PAS domain S-box-containing protein